MVGENILDGFKADEVTAEEELPLSAHCVCIYPHAHNPLKGQFWGLIYVQPGAFGEQHINLLLISRVGCSSDVKLCFCQVPQRKGG